MSQRKRAAAAPAGLQFWAIPVSLPEGDFIAHLCEPARTSAPQLLRQLRSGQYTKPFVLDDGEYRQLHFGLRFVQSRIELRRPDALTLLYTRKMMAFLLFQPQPRDVLLIGLGGGAMTRFCHRQLPQTQITTVEIDPVVIEMARHLFGVPADDARLRLIEGDGARHVSRMRRAVDVLIVDACDRHGIADAFCSLRFCTAARARLRPGGVLVVNLIGSGEQTRAMLDNLEHAFEGRLLILPVRGYGNRIVFAFRDTVISPHTARIQRRAAVLGKQHGIELPRFAQQFEALKPRTAKPR